jgi:site-specific recombinase XerC
MDTPLAQLIDRFSQYQTAAGRARGTIQRYQITFRLFTRFLSATDRPESRASLTLESINLNSRRLTVIGKGNKERQMVFSPTVRDMVREFLSIRGVDDEPLFHLTANGIKTMFRRIQLDVGLEKFHPHQCRHQFATTMLRRGEHLEVIGVMLGHDDYNTTRRYLSIDDTDIARAHEAASPFDTMMGQTAPPAPSRPRQRYSNRRTTG